MKVLPHSPPLAKTEAPAFDFSSTIVAQSAAEKKRAGPVLQGCCSPWTAQGARLLLSEPAQRHPHVFSFLCPFLSYPPVGPSRALFGGGGGGGGCGGGGLGDGGGSDGGEGGAGGGDGGGGLGDGGGGLGEGGGGLGGGGGDGGSAGGAGGDGGGDGRPMMLSAVSFEPLRSALASVASVKSMVEVP